MIYSDNYIGHAGIYLETSPNHRRELYLRSGVSRCLKNPDDVEQGNSLMSKDPSISKIYGEIFLGHRNLTEIDFSVDEKKVFGRVIDMWAAGDPKNPYAHSTETKLIKRSEEDDLSTEAVQKVLRGLEAKDLIHIVEENGESTIKYKVGAEQIVRELQKTTYVHEARDFKPHRDEI